MRPTGSGVTSVEVSFAARRGERYLGFGERSNAVDQRGRSVENYVAEGPFEKDERAAVPAFVPPWGFHPRADATYFPMPWLLSTAGYGVLVDNAETSEFHLGGRGSWSVEVAAPRLELHVFGGPRPADVLRRMTARVGRQPAPPGAFVFGPWYQPRDDEEAILADLQRRDVPLSVAQTYTHYLPCEAQRDRREAERARVARFHRGGARGDHLLQPDDLHDAHALRAAGDPAAQPGWRALRISILDAPELLGGRVRLRQRRAAARCTRDLLRRGARRRPRRLDGGLRRVHAAGRARRAGRDGHRPAQRATRPSTTAPPSRRRRGRRASCARAGPARPSARRSCGAATRASTGASTGCARS